MFFFVYFTLPQVFFKHFASQIQLPGLSVSGTLVENGLSSYTLVNISEVTLTIASFQFRQCGKEI